MFQSSNLGIGEVVSIGLKIRTVPFVRALTNVCATPVADPASPTSHLIRTVPPRLTASIIGRLFP